MKIDWSDWADEVEGTHQSFVTTVHGDWWFEYHDFSLTSFLQYECLLISCLNRRQLWQAFDQTDLLTAWGICQVFAWSKIQIPTAPWHHWHNGYKLASANWLDQTDKMVVRCGLNSVTRVTVRHHESRRSSWCRTVILSDRIFNSNQTNIIDSLSCILFLLWHVHLSLYMC